jgi:hypothetical protein
MARPSLKAKTANLKKFSLTFFFDQTKKEDREIFTVLQDFKQERISETMKPYLAKAVLQRINSVKKIVGQQEETSNPDRADFDESEDFSLPPRTSLEPPTPALDS